MLGKKISSWEFKCLTQHLDPDLQYFLIVLQYLSEESENLFPKHWPLVLSKILPKESEPPPRLWSTRGLSSPSLSTSAGPPPTSGTSAWPLQVRLTSTTARRHHCHPAACQAVPGVHNQDQCKSTTSAKAQPTSAKAQDQCKSATQIGAKAQPQILRKHRQTTKQPSNLHVTTPQV